MGTWLIVILAVGVLALGAVVLSGVSEDLRLGVDRILGPQTQGRHRAGRDDQ